MEVNMELSKELMKQALKSEQDEINGVVIYAFMSKRQSKKFPENAKILKEMSQDEYKHYKMWASMTKVEKKPHTFFLKVLVVIMGITFTIKKKKKTEKLGVENYT